MFYNLILEQIKQDYEWQKKHISALIAGEEIMKKKRIDKYNGLSKLVKWLYKNPNKK